jgi:NitT/TauT family transport system permease protein
MLRLDVSKRDRAPAAPDKDAPAAAQPVGWVRLAWRGFWPRLGALVLVLAAWQLIVASGWRPSYVLPGPAPVLQRLLNDLRDGALLQAVAVTLRRAVAGYAIALLAGAAVGLAVARIPVLRAAGGSLISGLQSMPSVAWFPLAIVLFKLSDAAILFVVVLGTAPSIANGLISGIDHIPPLLLRAGRALNARGPALYRHVILPAALPGFLSGLKQGWAFAWRSLMAGELLVIIANQPSLGVRLQFARELSDAEGLLAAMLVVLAIGIVVDAFIFGSLERIIRERWGLIDPAG